ncbi:FAD-dependent oxidoreductase [Mesosutterella sp. AGMB02718]|uniref:FAD-dependent oxidoreductase n=1 Tax=Mesosutterella faecium TaxID=2925194 RepID=A0ABT7IP97_9BURK|nr:FAD-dependent oxidoreductase [Mesosutterella sp. AGMB02718]MDL2060194.1 FAD-dependent oxidoreductase [Mesosutterella sp. AGMB02718]
MKRRGFLKLAAAGVLGACASVPAWAAAQAVSADVVVVGGGGSGLAAAVRAAELGAKVVLLEKNGVVGGGAAFAEGLFGIESRWQRAKNYGLSIPHAAEYLQRFDHFKSDAKFRRLYLEQSAPTLDWVAQHGVKFEAIQVSPSETLTWHVIGQYKGDQHGAAYVHALADSAAKLGVKTLLSTPAKSLIMKNGRVAGVKAEGAAGELDISASAVILATGGFGDNPELVRSLLGYDPARVKSSVPLHKTGDGFLMAKAAGGAQTAATAVMHPGTEGRGIKFLSNLYVMSWQPANLWVNDHGERFAPETLSFEFALAGNAIASQLHSEGWVIFDDAAIDYMKTQGADVGVGVIIPTMTKLPNIRSEINAAIAQGSDAVKSGATAEELARAIGVPPSALKKTLETYNRAAEEKYDGEFFKLTQWLRPIGKGRLYALRLRPYWFCTLGGTRTDRSLRVVDGDDRPIPGLYAVGAETGRMYGDTYTTWTSGHLFGFAAWSGKAAAETALKDMGK